MAHNYTNPAFCPQGELLDEQSISTTPSKIHRTESTRSFHLQAAPAARRNVFQRTHSERKQLPPKPGPKPPASYGSVTSISTTGKYALVPLEELSSRNKGRYAVVPESEVQRIAKSQENLDRVGSPVEDRANLSDQFMSLPPISEPRLVQGFSTDFGSKSFILYDQKKQQRYEVVPTEENEEVVDPNTEVIQMQNGRVHRYAMIPTEEEETSLNNPPYAVISPPRPQRQLPPPPPQHLTPRKTPNPATQRLHELLSTPQKQVRDPNVTPQSTPVRARPPAQPRLTSSTPNRDCTPQQLRYEQIRASSVDVRTTAVISPRLQSQNTIYSETTVSSKSWSEAMKASHGSTTIGAISLMLVLTGILNAGLSLYIIYKNGRSYFLDAGTMAGFACVALGSLGFKSRQCQWLPNRNYISGYLLVTVFAILDCCGLLALLWLNPFPGFPVHDVTSGVILGLSSLTLLVISLGVVSSRWCQRVPIDARVDPV